MNKIGALVLVIGIALFLAYSFSHVNPAGRAAAAAIISGGILISGLIIERRRRYEVFSRGLIGAGWAALYVTAYAMYALPAAQIITNPFAGSVLLLAVAAAMIAHSLRYRVEGITALAYFTAFAALAVTPSTPFAVASLIPLAASLLYFGWRLEWYTLTLFGLIATYATCISRGNSNAPLYLAESLFIVYWVLFETFDILRSRRGSQSFGLTWIFPLNAIGFLALSYRAWLSAAGTEMWRMAAISASLFLASALLRLASVRVGQQEKIEEPFDTVRRGTYEPPFTLAAVLAGSAILGRVTGFWTNVSLAAEAEILYLAGVRFRSGFLRSLALSGFIASLADAGFTASSTWGKVIVAGVSLHNWTPSVLAHAGIFYLNRALWRSKVPFSFAASALFALVLAVELTPHAAPLALFAFALVLLEIGIRKALLEFRSQSYFAAAAAALTSLSTGGFGPHPAQVIWTCSAASAAACWLFTARTFFVRPNEVNTKELTRVRDGFAIAGSVFALLTLWMLFPSAATALAWTCFALLSVAVASLSGAGSFRWIAAGIIGIACLRLFAVNLTELWDAQSPAERLLIPLAVAAALYFLWLVFRSIPQDREHAFAPAFTFAATAIIMALLYDQVSGGLLTVAWGIQALASLAAGFPLRERILRLQGLGLLALCVVKLFVYDLRNLETVYRILSFIALGVILLGVSWIYTRFRVRIRRYI